MRRRGNRQDLRPEERVRRSAAADFNDIFDTFFGGRGRGGGGSQEFAVQGEDLEIEVELSVPEVFSGITRRVELSERVPCKGCGGTGVVRSRACVVCGGSGIQLEKRSIEVRIPAGVQEGTRIRVAGKGQPGFNGGKPGDLYLKAHIKSTGVFRLHGTDLSVTLPIWPWEAALGAEVMAPTLTEPVRVKIPSGSKSDAKLRLKGKGLPTASGGYGDLFLRLKIVMPSPISKEELARYEEIARLPHNRSPRRAAGCRPARLVWCPVSS